MSSIDRALRKAYERRNPEASELSVSDAPADSAMGAVRELYVHPAEGVRPPMLRIPEPENGAGLREEQSSEQASTPIPDSMRSARADAVPLDQRTNLLDLLRYEVVTDDIAVSSWHDAGMGQVYGLEPTQSRLGEESSAGTVAPASPALPYPSDRPVPTEPLQFQETQKCVDSTSVVHPEVTILDGTNHRTEDNLIPLGSSAVGNRHEDVGSFKAAWEVDRFVLPKTCDRALAQLHDRLKLATHELLEVCVPSRPVISICSWLPGEGRTTLGILLAKALANGGQRVLLVDADWQNPGLASQVGVDPQDGWCPEKATLGELADCCVYSLEDQFTILPLTERNRGMETESRHAWLTSIEQLSSHFQYVLLDHRPGVVVANQTISDHLGLWLLVRDLRRTSDESLDQFAKQMESQVPAPIRIVENFAHLGQEMEQVA